MTVGPMFAGRWRFVGMSAWDQEFVDLVAPGHLTVSPDGSGTLAFGAVEAQVRCRLGTSGGRARLTFTFTGSDEGDEVSGKGWALAEGDRMEGRLQFDLGDGSAFVAQRQDLT